MMRRLRSRAIALVGVVALLPLVALGALSIRQARKTVLDKAMQTQHDLAARAAAEIESHVSKYTGTLRRLGHTLGPSVHLSPSQAERILKDYRSDVRDIRRIDLVGRDGHEIATARPDGKTRDRGDDPAVQAALAGHSYRSKVTISRSDLVPEIVLAEPQRFAGEVVGALVATVDLTEMWRIIDPIKVGETGYARVVGEDGTLLAIGDNAQKRRVFTQEKDESSPIVEAVLGGRALVAEYRGSTGVRLVAAGQPIRKLGWGLILEQPVREALAPYYDFTEIILAISVVLLAGAAVAGLLAARSVVDPIERLRLRAGEIAQGLLDRRIEIASPEELHALADAMNQMCSDLIRLQEDVKKKERIATLGRLAAGLAHDLKHPVRALQVNAKLVLEKPEDAQVREVFGQVVQREFRKLEGFLDDLRRVSRDEPMNFARSRLDLSSLVRKFAREQEAGGAPACVQVRIDAPVDGLPVNGNAELLERVLSNLASNAYEAMEGEGELVLRTSRAGGEVELDVTDTGPGIPPERVAGLFNDFGTTKKRGLGLGLAVCKKIIHDHGGTITVQSEVGRGTEFVIRLPAVKDAA